MITLAWYLLKIMICSGILCGYYYLALRNKIFHRWNRFYLLASIVLALGVPLMKISIFQKAGAEKGTVVRMLQTITNSDEIIIEYSRKNSGLQLSFEKMIEAAYLLVSLILLSIFFLALYKISRLKKKYPETRLKGISFISTDAKGTPFSFFNSIFWNNAIDLHSKQGHQIFNHEIAHVKEKHSYDKVFINVVLLFFWINPFFWIMRKELGMIHEFIADKEALEDNDINAFAEMILQTVYPGQRFSLTNNFFHSPLKRRLTMFTKNKNPKASYLSRLLVLPLTAIVFFAFTLKMKMISIANPNHYAGKKITVVIDAGHGGGDDGAVENNIKEKDLNLAIAKEIKEINKNENLNIVLSRTGDELLTPKDRINFAEANKADVFVSIHVDAEESKNTHKGVIIFIPKDGNAYLTESKLLGSAIAESFKSNDQLPVSGYLQQQGVWVLKANQFPSVLIETGFLTTQTDFNYITKPANQQTIAGNILHGIEKYAEQNSLNNSGNISAISDTTPQPRTSGNSDRLSKALFVVDGKIVSDKEAKDINPSNISSITVLKGEDAIKKYGEKGKDGVIEISKKNEKNITDTTIKEVSEVQEVPGTLRSPIYFVDEKEISNDEVKRISPADISSMNVLKGESAIKKYGEKGKNGVVEITTRKSYSAQKDSIPDKVFTKVENEAAFPGGQEAWSKYITSQILKNRDKFTNKDFGTCLVKFIVNTDGSVSNVEDSTMKNTQLGKVAVEAIRSGPKWVPATQNNHVVAAYRLQPISLMQPK